MFHLEQAPLHIQSRSKSTQTAVAGNHPVARYDDGEGVSCQRLSHSLHRSRYPHLSGNPGIALSLSVGDGECYSPYRPLESGGIGHIQFIGESDLVTTQIALQPLGEVASVGLTRYDLLRITADEVIYCMRRVLGQDEAA